MIIRLELAPGDVVREEALQQQLGIGRTPIREALQRLARDQFVTVIPRRGMLVSSIDVSEFSLLFETRSVMEPYAARLGCMMIGTFDALWAIVLDDLGSADWVANVGITFFALPLIFLGSYGGRLAQRVGPFRLGPLGLLLGAGFMFSYGFVPTGAAMLAVGIVHAMCDGFTVSSAAVGVGMVSPPDRQASAQGMLGAAETLVGGLTAVLAGVLYSWGGRELAFTTCSVVMISLATGAWFLAGPEVRSRRGQVGLTTEQPAAAPV